MAETSARRGARFLICVCFLAVLTGWVLGMFSVLKPLYITLLAAVVLAVLGLPWLVAHIIVWRAGRGRLERPRKWVPLRIATFLVP